MPLIPCNMTGPQRSDKLQSPGGHLSCSQGRVRPIWCALRCRWVGIKLANRMLSHHMDACSRQMGHSDIQRSLRKTSAPVKMAMATDSLEKCRLPLEHRRHRIVDFELNRWQVWVQRTTAHELRGGTVYRDEKKISWPSARRLIVVGKPDFSFRPNPW